MFSRKKQNPQVVAAGVANADADTLVTPSAMRVLVREFLKDKFAIIAFSIAVVIILGAFVGGIIWSADKVTTVNVLDRYLAPGVDGHILGTDASGRDMFHYLFVAARNSIFIGVSVAILNELIGIILGTVSGYFGGAIDNVLMRIVDFWMVLPHFLIIIILAQLVNNLDPMKLVWILTLFSWTSTTRLIRSQILTQSEREYVMASKTSGTPNVVIMFREVLPNISSFVITDLTLTVASSIGIETGLSFLGFGLPASQPSLGTLIGYANDPVTIIDYWWVWLPAAVLLLTLSLSINAVGQALKRAANARQRRG